GVRHRGSPSAGSESREWARRRRAPRWARRRRARAKRSCSSARCEECCAAARRPATRSGVAFSGRSSRKDIAPPWWLGRSGSRGKAMTNRTWILALSFALYAACAGNKENVDITKPVTGAEASNAEKAYTRGLQEKKEKNYFEAIRYLEYVRNNFPYS